MNIPSIERSIYQCAGALFDLFVCYLAPGGGCEVLLSPCLSVCMYVRVSGQYFGILFLGY